METIKSAQECFNCVAKDFGKTPEVEKYMELVASSESTLLIYEMAVGREDEHFKPQGHI